MIPARARRWAILPRNCSGISRALAISRRGTTLPAGSNARCSAHRTAYSVARVICILTSYLMYIGLDLSDMKVIAATAPVKARLRDYLREN